MAYGDNLYGELMYIDEGNVPLTVGDLIPNLMAYLPEYYEDCKQTQEIQEAFAKKIGEWRYDIKDIVNQLFIDTATWGLPMWEEMLAIPVDINKSFNYRRERIKAKIRGAGTTTKKMLVNTASAFAGGEVEVYEYPSEHRFVIKFVGVKGVPSNMQDLNKTIDEIKPAHLLYSYEYTYTIWNVINKQNTWNVMKSYTWDRARVI